MPQAIAHRFTKKKKRQTHLSFTFGINVFSLFFYADKPDISLERSSVQGGEGMPAVLSCSVHADPPAKVHWEKNGIEIDSKNAAIVRASR